MSYDIWLEHPADGAPDGPSWNYTSNCAPMWEAAGIDLAACSGLDAGGCAEGLGAALGQLREDPERFRALNPSNGWGDYDSLVPELEVLLARWESAPYAIVRVGR